MSIAANTQTLYVAGPREHDDPYGDLPEQTEYRILFFSQEIATHREGLGLVSTGESLEDYRKRRQEGMVRTWPRN